MNIWAFFLCAILVFITQFNLLQPILQYRLFNTTEDWPYLIYYHTLDLNFLDKMIYVWKTFGLHSSAQVFHIGILSDFLGFNYSAYQIVNVTLKAIGTISVFPLILVLFRNEKLAFLATILFGISSATAGSFLWIVKGSEYIGIALLNIFLITYYFVILKNSKLLMILSSLLFLMAYLMAPPRMFPQLLLIPLVEIYWLIRSREIKNLKFSIIRILIYILPVILISLSAPVSPGFPFTKQPFVLLRNIVSGNWHNLLDPFAGIDWTLFTNDYWKFFGTLQPDTFRNFGNYLNFLFSGPFFIFGILTLFLCPILSKKPAKFFIFVFGLNFIAQILVFIIASHHYGIPTEFITPYNPDHFLYTKYPTIVGIYIFIVAFAAFLEWRKNKENILQAIWVGPLFSVVFLWPTWLIMGPLINDWSSVHWYFAIPAMGTTLLMAAILVLFYEKFKHKKIAKSFVTAAILGIIFIFYQNHGAAISKQYLSLNPEKVSLADQQIIHEKFVNTLNKAAMNGNLLVYLDITSDTVNLSRTIQYYKEALAVTNFGEWVHFRREGTGRINNGCIDAIIDKKVLESTINFRNGGKVFIYKGVCVDRDLFNNKDEVVYKVDDFYAFKVQDGEFIDIKHEIIKDLGIQ